MEKGNAEILPVGAILAGRPPPRQKSSCEVSEQTGRNTMRNNLTVQCRGDTIPRCLIAGWIFWSGFEQ
jgi:hypothetical protein